MELTTCFQSKEYDLTFLKLTRETSPEFKINALYLISLENPSWEQAFQSELLAFIEQKTFEMFSGKGKDNKDLVGMVFFCMEKHGTRGIMKKTKTRDYNKANEILRELLELTILLPYDLVTTLYMEIREYVKQLPITGERVSRKIIRRMKELLSRYLSWKTLSRYLMCELQSYQGA